ncbi:6-pyruvoyl tetrahydropterin synthase family protein [Synechococcus sp. Cruz CV-v-12]|uniref:6-pyruvoyl trahydropterin synthase family protein n=1 Tax=Synechococcus sp. Cruz CV-v-12 TaxID=2823728 RepID=UPI0020CEB9D4|nr:6-carboxytetrahydropterin synthase [Synechococcus sp. Cruz CV-v-12]MCP9874384.1 6-carboxytetrahydropterin synthase [Synechococcus sp. Cruz CV-v-12]
MVTLTRAVRFCVNATDDEGTSRSNGYAGVPAMVGLGTYYELLISCRGEPDPATGYFLDIKVIDRAARATIVPHISRAFRLHGRADPGAVLTEGLSVFRDELAREAGGADGPWQGQLASVRWQLSPHYSIEVCMDDSANTVPAWAVMRQRFEIAAAHRLHVPGLSDEANRATFGKCNNPSGHGHNYVIEPAVRVPTGAGSASVPFTVSDLQAIVQREIIEPFDHTHLNIDTPEFRQPGGVNPSVENISRVFYERLAPAIASGGRGATLQSVTVFETEKTSSTFPA